MEERERTRGVGVGGEKDRGIREGEKWHGARGEKVER